MIGMSLMVTRDTWTHWRRDMFGDPYLVWHDGPDFRRLVPAVTEDPDEVVRMLCAGLGEQDPVAAFACEFLSEQRLIPPGVTDVLRVAAVAAQGGFRVYVARALFALTGDRRRRMAGRGRRDVRPGAGRPAITPRVTGRSSPRPANP
jgi:hypothetical protein